MYRVTWVNLRWPLGPSSRHCSNLGMTTISSWMMIELVMYGMIPSPKTAILVRAPPENRLRYAMTPPLFAAAARDWTALKSTPGQMMLSPSRYTPMMNRVNRILLRRSPIRKAAFKFRMLVGIGIAAASNCSWS